MAEVVAKVMYLEADVNRVFYKEWCTLTDKMAETDRDLNPDEYNRTYLIREELQRLWSLVEDLPTVVVPLPPHMGFDPSA